jgi:hypothetical protein
MNRRMIEISGGFVPRHSMVAAKTHVYIPFRIRLLPKICDLELSVVGKNQPPHLPLQLQKIAKG